jgi:putative CocE/NonD family hydrolase
MRHKQNLLQDFLLSLLLLTAHGISAQQPAAAPTPVAIRIESASFDPYVGQYQDPVNLPGTVISFFREGDKFYLRVTNQDKLEITPSAANKFFNISRNFDVEFRRDASDKVTGARFTQGATYELKKIADAPQADSRIPYTRTEAMIPMRDGVKLFTVILAPEGQSENLPFYMERTPYGVAGANSSRVNASKAEMARERYIFVYQDIRGREDSEGVFEMLRPPRDKRDPKAIDESTDTYDTIDWLLKNVPKNNGRVGIGGVSYPGWLAAVALIDPHPALKASSPQAPVVDLWLGDDFMHNGAFRQTYAYEWAVPLESVKKGGDIMFDKPDMVEWYMPLGKMQALAPELAKKSHSWRGFVEHPSYDSYWQARATELYLKETSVPTLVVGGWWDQEDMFGALTLYQTLQKTDRDNQVFLVMGPWNHGGWGGGGQRLGAIDFGAETGRQFRQNILAPFFAKLLKEKGSYTPPEASIFRSGLNKWMSYDAWTPKNNRERDLYLQANGRLSFDKPAEKGEAVDSYTSDPTDPVPYRKAPILATYTAGSSWSRWLVDDQRFLEGRKDVLTYKTDALTEDLTISGDVIANLTASTSGTDSDWVVKLIDEYGADEGSMAGYQLMVADEIFRGRYREDYVRPKALEAGKPLDYKIDMRGNDHTFKKGHRIVVQVQSTWFPLYDRNPQTFVPNIFKAVPTDFKPATQRVYRSASHPSHVKVWAPAN